MKLCAPLLLLVTVALATITGAQNTIAQPVTIDGAVHPELIPDEAAALAVFSVHSMFGSAAVNANTEKHHAKIGLSDADRVIYHAAMQLFHSDKASRPRAYQSVMSSLSFDGQSKLKAFIQAEKRNMHYHLQQPIPQEVNQ